MIPIFKTVHDRQVYMTKVAEKMQREIINLERSVDKNKIKKKVKKTDNIIFMTEKTLKNLSNSIVTRGERSYLQKKEKSQFEKQHNN